MDSAAGRDRDIIYVPVGMLNTITPYAVDSAGNVSAPASITVDMR